MVADSVFYLCRFRFCTAALINVLLEVLVQDRNRLDALVNAFRLQVFVRDCAEFWRDAFHAEAFIPKVFAGKDVDFSQRL